MKIPTLDDFTKQKKPWLPEGVEWREVKLGDNKIAEIVMGQSPPSSSYNKDGNGKPFLQGNKEFGEFNPKHVMYTTDPKKLCKKDDVLISVRAPVGDVNIADREYCIGRGLAAIRFYGEPKYLFYLLISMKEEIEDLGKRGTTFKAITKKHLKNLKIPLPFRNGKPDLETQRRIVEYIEASFSRIDEILERKKRELAHLDELWESVLEQAFRPGPGEEWREVKLEKIAKLTSGGTPSRKISKFWENATIPWVKSAELKDNIIYDTEEKISMEGLKKSSAKMFSKGTLLVALYGANVGKTAILGIDASTNQAVCAILPKSSEEILWTNKYLFYFFWYIRPYLIYKSKGGAQPNIYVHTLKNLKIPLPFRNGKPDLEKQREIAEHLDGVYEKIKVLKEKIQGQISQLEEMKESILEGVFNNNV